MWTSKVGLAYKVSDTTTSACLYKFQFYEYSNYVFFRYFFKLCQYEFEQQSASSNKNMETISD